MRKLLLGSIILFGMQLSIAQEYFPTNTSISQSNENFTAFTNATIHVNPTEIINDGTLIIKNGKVVNTGKRITIPKNSIIIDLKGKHIYPSFIEMYSNFGIQKSKRDYAINGGPQDDAGRQGCI